ncbi:MAG: ATP-binding protein [Gammaproteobacteria bacterium]|nr:ATP-binding protein [Gammaproteobacteria bacterium]
MAETELNNIYQRFYQINNPERSGDNSGLGLAIVKRIMQLHQIEIVVESALGEGTCFSFQLPVVNV